MPDRAYHRHRAQSEYRAAMDADHTNSRLAHRQLALIHEVAAFTIRRTAREKLRVHHIGRALQVAFAPERRKSALIRQQTS